MPDLGARPHRTSTPKQPLTSTTTSSPLRPDSPSPQCTNEQFSKTWRDFGPSMRTIGRRDFWHPARNRRPDVRDSSLPVLPGRSIHGPERPLRIISPFPRHYPAGQLRGNPFRNCPWNQGFRNFPPFSGAFTGFSARPACITSSSRSEGDGRSLVPWYTAVSGCHVHPVLCALRHGKKTSNPE